VVLFEVGRADDAVEESTMNRPMKHALALGLLMLMLRNASAQAKPDAFGQPAPRPNSPFGI
jgi:hypothetical protein